MSNPVADAIKQLAATWQQEATEGRKRSAVNPIADATESHASELLAVLADVETSTRTLTVEQFAHANNTTPSTVRRWCVRGELPAEKDANGDWTIPRAARRMKRTG